MTVSCGPLSFDTVSRVFTYDGVSLQLTPREHAVLEVLIHRAGKAVPKEKLFDEVFKLEDSASLDAVEIYVHRLRKKLERSGSSGVGIVTLRGLGYLLQQKSA